MQHNTANHSKSSGFLSTFGLDKSTGDPAGPRLRGTQDPLASCLRKPLRPATSNKAKHRDDGGTYSTQQMKPSLSTSATAAVTSPMALFMKLQSALVSSGFNESLWSLVKESELLAGMLLPYGLFLRHTLQAFPSAALQALNTVDGFIVEGTDEKLVVQIYKVLDSMFGFKPAISSNQFLNAYNPCGSSKFCGHMIQTCTSFLALMSQREKVLLKEARGKQQQLRIFIHQEHISGGGENVQYYGTHQRRCGYEDEHRSHQLMVTNNYREDVEKMKLHHELHEARHEIFGGGGLHHQRTSVHRGGPAEVLDRSELFSGGGVSTVHSDFHAVVAFDNKPVRVGTTSNIPIEMGGKLTMKCEGDATATTNHHAICEQLHHNAAITAHRGQTHVIKPPQTAASSASSSALLIANRDRFGQYVGGDISSVAHFEVNRPEAFRQVDAGCSPTSYSAGGEVLDALIQIEGSSSNDEMVANGVGGVMAASPPNSPSGCCTRHALHTIKHHNKTADKAKVELCKLELQHAALNSQKRTGLNREVGGFRL